MRLLTCPSPLSSLPPSHALQHDALLQYVDNQVKKSSQKLRKGEILEFEGTSNVTVATGWTSRSGDAVDLDLHCMLFGADGKLKEVVGYNKLTDESGAVE